MKSEFDEKHDVLQSSESLQNCDLKLSARQSKIYQNLEAIGPEIAAFYLDGIRILQNDDLKTAANLLAHITREIDGGLRDVLSETKKEELEFVVSMPDGNEKTYEKRKAGSFTFESKTPGRVKVNYKPIGKHEVSILQSLGINEHSPLAERWLEVTGDFHKFAHRHGAWNAPREKETFRPLWDEFEEVLEDLVGNYLNLLIRVVDRILACEEPTKEIRKVLPHLLKSEKRREYFFKNLNSPTWLKPLKEDRWFDPESNVVVRANKSFITEHDWCGWWKPLIDAGWFDTGSSSLARTSARKTCEYNTVLPWHALEYVERVAEHIKKHPCDETIDTLVEIVDIIVDCADDTREKIIRDSTLTQRIIKIISALPEEKRKDEHLDFSRLAWRYQSNEYQVFTARAGEAHRFVESIEQNTNPALGEFLSNISRADRIDFPREIREIIDGENHHITEQGLANVYTERGLANIYREYVVVILRRFESCLSIFQEVLSPDQYSILSELLAALHNRKEIDWEALLKFIHGLLSLEQFWTEQDENSFKYRHQILGDAAELIAVGVNDDTHAFDRQLLPLTEQILFMLVEKAESRCVLKGSPMDIFLNSSKGMVFQAMMEYALRFAHANGIQQEDFRWSQAIRANFTKRLDRNIEPSFEFSFVIGAYLPQLLYLDRKWVVDNIDRIFPQQDEHHWYIAFSMYLIFSCEICKSLYFLLKDAGHYQKALNTNFDHHAVEKALATHICSLWLEEHEDLNDETSLIYQIVNSSNLNFLSAIVHFFWDQRDNLSTEDKAKVRHVWRVLFKIISHNKDEKRYREVLDKLSKWVVFIDSIDQEVLEWLKLSVRYVTWDIRILIKTLLSHAPETPTEVGTIYLELSKRGIGKILGSRLEQDEVMETIRILYSAGHKKTADQICIQFAEAGLDFLKPVYKAHQH